MATLPAWLTRRPALPDRGALCAAAGLALLLQPGLQWAALGVELVAMAFWLWSRVLPDRADALARWSWLRRPAMALWLGAGLVAALPELRAAVPSLVDMPGPGAALPPALSAAAGTAREPMSLLRTLASLAVLWAGLELMAALPLSRPIPDLPGPARTFGPWLTALLPVTGFLVLWRQASQWNGSPFVRDLAFVALLLAVAVGTLRAYSRRSLVATLRWLVVVDSCLASMLVARDVVPGMVAALLWTGAAGARLIALAAELRGQAVRRGAGQSLLWRRAGWVASAALAWPLLTDVGFSGGRLHPIAFVLLSAPVFLAAVVWIRRLEPVPERRAAPRPSDHSAPLARLGAFFVTVTGPAALLWAWWNGYEAGFPGVAVALLPSVLAWWPVRRFLPEAAEPPEEYVPGGPRDFALSTFRVVTVVERALANAAGSLGRALGAPARDLHSGDAQEYLLFLTGVAVLALLLPLLR